MNKQALVDFIIPTYNRKEPLKCMLASLMSQTNKNWTAEVIQDGSSDLAYIVREFNDPRITFSHTSKRWNDWGHTLREIGKQKSSAKYIIMTGDDNYYTPNFVEELRKATNDSPGIVYWDMVHSHYNYQLFKCKLIINEIDMGAFATRNDLAKQIKLGTSFAADGEYVRDFVKMFPKTIKRKIDKVLFVHN